MFNGADASHYGIKSKSSLPCFFANSCSINQIEFKSETIVFCIYTIARCPCNVGNDITILPIKAFMNEDFPAFGRPTTANLGNSLSSGSSLSGNAFTKSSSNSPVPLPFILEDCIGFQNQANKFKHHSPRSSIHFIDCQDWFLNGEAVLQPLVHSRNATFHVNHVMASASSMASSTCLSISASKYRPSFT